MSAYAHETLDELLADPLIQKMMRADRVETGALRGMLNRVALRLGAEAAPRRALVAFSPQIRPRPATTLWPSPRVACELRC